MTNAVCFSICHPRGSGNDTQGLGSILRKLLFIFFFTSHSFACATADDEVTITRAVDGETLELSDGRTIRLIGILSHDVEPILVERLHVSPERVRFLPLSRLSQDVTDFVEKNVAGRNAILSFDPANEALSHKDSEGRLLAYVWYSLHYKADSKSDASKVYGGFITEDHLLNGELIKYGYGFVDTRKPFLQEKLFLSYEQEAAQNQRGIWRSAADLYQDLLQKARTSHSGSEAGFVPQFARELGLKTAWKSFSDLIAANPEDWRPYYERSWLGASSNHDLVSEENLKDAEKAAALSPLDPKCYLQRHYLLRLLGRHEEAGRAYEKAVGLAAKLGMRTEVTDHAVAALSEVAADQLQGVEGRDSLLADGMRAALNEDHFFIFMSRLKSSDEFLNKEVQPFLVELAKHGRFQELKVKYQGSMEAFSPRSLIYRTRWAQHGLAEPEKVLQEMETLD